MIKNLIYIVEGGIGHHFNNTPVFKYLKKNNPNLNLIVLCPFLEVFRFNPYVDELYSLDDSSTNMVNLYRRLRKEGYQCLNPSVYRNHFNLTNNLHIKQIIAKQCNISITNKESLEYYPTEEETNNANNFKFLKTEDKKLLGIVQVSGSGIGNNPVGDLKGLPLHVAEEVINLTKDRVSWIQVRMRHEPLLNYIDYDLMDYDHRKIFALLSVSDLGFGVESFCQHVISGVYNKPFVMCLGRGRKENYAHQSSVIVENQNSCEFFGCEFPFFGLRRICNELKCMNSITSKQILKELDNVISSSIK